MLQAPAPFPHTGSTGYLRGTARKLTIIQRNADGSCTVKLHPPRFMSAPERLEWANRGASLTTRVPAGDIYANEDAATWCGRPPVNHRRRAPRGRR